MKRKDQIKPNLHKKTKKPTIIPGNISLIPGKRYWLGKINYKYIGMTHMGNFKFENPMNTYRVEEFTGKEVFDLIKQGEES